MTTSASDPSSIGLTAVPGRGTVRDAVQFSFAHIPPEKLAATIPNTMRWMRAKGLDPQRDLLDVGIAFQCLNGGVRMTDTNAMSTIEYKSEERRRIATKGYRIAMSVSDQWSDLLGEPKAEVSIKLPNPFYFLP